MALWIKLCSRSSVIFDIGANTGVYTLVAKSIKPDSKVFAFEPVSRVFEKLVYNCKLNNFSVETIDKAVSDFDGEASIYEPMEEHILSVTVNKNLQAAEQPVVETRIQTIRLDTVIDHYNLKGIELVKIDVETHEAEVLAGFGEYLKKFKPTMLIEILTQEVAENIEEIVADLGYLFFNINEDGGIREVKTLTKSDYYNFLFCDQETAKFLNINNNEGNNTGRG